MRDGLLARAVLIAASASVGAVALPAGAQVRSPLAAMDAAGSDAIEVGEAASAPTGTVEPVESGDELRATDDEPPPAPPAEVAETPPRVGRAPAEVEPGDSAALVAEEEPRAPEPEPRTAEPTEIARTAPPGVDRESAEAEPEGSASSAADEEEPTPAAERAALEVALHGYYRARAHVVGNMMYVSDRISGESWVRRDQLYLTQRLRLQPEASWGELAGLHVTLDCLDNVVWGDNAGRASTAAFADEPSATGLGGSEEPFVYVRHAWIEVNVRLGLLRVGRQPSDWGLGLLTNAGEGFDDDFGDNWYGSSYDRILFATKPISIARAVAGLDPQDTPLVLAFAYDKLVEDPLAEGERRTSYFSDWLANNSDDVDEYTIALVWRQDPVHIVAPDDSLAAGLYYVYRDQESTFTGVHVVDGFFKLHLWDLFAEGEIMWITGTSRAIPLGSKDLATGLYEEKEANILGWLFRAGYDGGIWRVKAETGYASGDDNPNDYDFTGRPLHPDVNVGLIMYEELLAEWTRMQWADKESLWSHGGVYNSYYFMVTGIVEPVERLEIILGFLNAWLDRADEAVLSDDHRDGNVHLWLGAEIDLAVRYRFYDDHVRAVIEGGWLRPADAPFGLQKGLVDTDMWTFQSRVAFVF